MIVIKVGERGTAHGGRRTGAAFQAEKNLQKKLLNFKHQQGISLKTRTSNNDAPVRRAPSTVHHLRLHHLLFRRFHHNSNEILFIKVHIGGIFYIIAGQTFDGFF